jgi:uncharacterized lipoprotein YajG
MNVRRQITTEENQEMRVTKGVFVIASIIILAGCSSKNDAISQAEKTGNDRPSIAETKAIAEEGFIYGLPIVMNYA